MPEQTPRPAEVPDREVVVYLAFDGKPLWGVYTTREAAEVAMDERLHAGRRDVVVTDEWTNLNVPEARPAWWRYFTSDGSDVAQHQEIRTVPLRGPSPPAPGPGAPITDLAGKVYGYWPTTDPRTTDPRTSPPAPGGGDCTCFLSTSPEIGGAHEPHCRSAAPGVEDGLRAEVERRLNGLADQMHDARDRAGLRIEAANVVAPDGPYAALAARSDADRDALARVRALHRPFGIFDECGHEHAEGEPGVTDVLDVGLVCEDGRIKTVCFECCGDGYSQSEECATDHTDCWPCETRAALAPAATEPPEEEQ